VFELWKISWGVEFFVCRSPTKIVRILCTPQFLICQCIGVEKTVGSSTLPTPPTIRTLIFLRLFVAFEITACKGPTNGRTDGQCHLLRLNVLTVQLHWMTVRLRGRSVTCLAVFCCRIRLICDTRRHRMALVRCPRTQYTVTWCHRWARYVLHTLLLYQRCRISL